jgi:Na+/H+ antiporter NhaC
VRFIQVFSLLLCPWLVHELFLSGKRSTEVSEVVENLDPLYYITGSRFASLVLFFFLSFGGDEREKMGERERVLTVLVQGSVLHQKTSSDLHRFSFRSTFANLFVLCGLFLVSLTFLCFTRGRRREKRATNTRRGAPTVEAEKKDFVLDSL